jgi:hypothetical protein
LTAKKSNATKRHGKRLGNVLGFAIWRFGMSGNDYSGLVERLRKQVNYHDTSTSIGKITKDASATTMSDAASAIEILTRKLAAVNNAIRAFNNGMPAMTTKEVAEENAALRTELTATKERLVEAVGIMTKLERYWLLDIEPKDMIKDFLAKHKASQ